MRRLLASVDQFDMTVFFTAMVLTMLIFESIKTDHFTLSSTQPTTQTVGSK